MAEYGKLTPHPDTLRDHPETSPGQTAQVSSLFEPAAQGADAMSKIQWDNDSPMMTRIKVIGVGGGGCNAVDDMVAKGFAGVEFYAINTDFQALKKSRIPNKIQIGEESMHGLGAGAIPELGEQAARASEEQIRALLDSADMVFITAGMGGGTGTGAAPVIAEIAKSMGILSVAIVTKPFMFEGPQRMRRATGGIKRLREHVDTMIVILNDKLMETVGPKTPLTEAFQVVNGVLAQGIRAISDLVSMPGLINVDFRDVRTIMGETGGAVMGVGVGKGENRATEAVKKACHSPLQEKIVIDGARGVLINITGGMDTTMHEINEATSLVYDAADPDANIIFGVVIDEKMKDEMRVTIIATGFSEIQDSAVSGLSAMGSERIRSRGSNLFASVTPLPSDVAEHGSVPAASVQEPDPVPALQRKRERELQPQAMSVDFNRDDNPLKGWDEPLREKSVEPATPPPPPRPMQRSEPLMESIPAAPVFDDSRPQDIDSQGDPYDIPALHRRRRQRFFE